MRLISVIFLLVLSFEQLLGRSITNKRSTSASGGQTKNIYDTSFFDNFHQLFGFYEVPPPPPKSDSTLGPAKPSIVSDVQPPPVESKPLQPAPVQSSPEVPQPSQPAPVEPLPIVPQPSQPAPVEPLPIIPQPSEPAPVQPPPIVPQPSQPAPIQPPPIVPQPSQPAPVQPLPIDPQPSPRAPIQPPPIVPQPSQPAPIQPTHIVPQPSQPAPVQPPPIVPKPLEPAPMQPSPVAPQTIQPEPVVLEPVPNHAPVVVEPVEAPASVVTEPAAPVVPQPASNPIQPLEPQADEPVNVRNFDPVLPSMVPQPAPASFVPQPSQPPVPSQPPQPPVVPQPAQPFQPSQPPVAPQPPQPPVSPQPAQPPVPLQPSQPPVPPQPSSNSEPTPLSNQPSQPTSNVQPVAPALPNKPSTHQGWPGAQQRQPYYGPPRPFGPQPWWRQPSLPPTIPQNLNASHPSQPKYVSSDNAIPNKNQDIKVGIPNKTPDLRPVRPLPPFHMEPSPFQLAREECITAQGELGECASHFECGQQGGRPRGLCHLGHDVSAHARTCCVYPSFCGYQTNREVTYFKNPNYPNVTSQLGDCLYRVNLLPGVCQVRVDFMDFLMKPMKNGDCEPANSLRVSSNDENAYIPVDKFCGLVASGDHDPLKTDIAHMYVNVDDDLPVDRPRTKRYFTKTVDFKVNIQNHPTRWNLRISQIQCDGANLQAPQGCAQYYNQNKGNMTSFNVLDGAYGNNMDLALCIKRDPAACAIHYRIHSMGVGPTKGGATGKTQLGYGLTCEDYLIFNGERTALCGSVSTGPKDIILPVKGEQGLTFRTDSIHIPKADTGFHIEYQYIHNCNGVEFYKYPIPGRRN